MLGDIRPGTDSFVVSQLLPAGSRMFLNANDELWVSDGTAAGTRKIGPGHSLDLEKAVLLNGRLYFTVENGSSTELWSSDGTEAGTKPLRTAAGEPLTSPTDLVAFEGRLWFFAGRKALVHGRDLGRNGGSSGLRCRHLQWRNADARGRTPLLRGLDAADRPRDLGSRSVVGGREFRTLDNIKLLRDHWRPG
jgi:ELWxxDGT repeat protein